MSYQGDRFTEIANALRAKLGGTAPIQAATFKDKIALIDNEDAYTVRFIDYDGTILSQQIVAPGESVTPPTVADKQATATRPALTFQGWNYLSSELQNIQLDLDPGAIYVPADGKTHAYIRLSMATGLSLPIVIVKTGTGTMTVEYGDGTQEAFTSSGNIDITHTYAAAGSYVIKVSITSGTYTLGRTGGYAFIGSSVQSYRDALLYCYVGTGCTTVGSSGFYANTALRAVTLHQSCTTVKDYGVYKSKTLKHFTFPRGVTLIDSALLSECSALVSASLPNTVTSLNGFDMCSSLARLCVPQSVTSLGMVLLRECRALIKFIIPSGVNSIGDVVLRDCTALKTLDIRCSSLSYFGDYNFYGCCALNKLIIRNVRPDYFQKVYTFASLYCIDDTIQIPSGTTSLGSNVFSSNHSRTYFDIPATVTSIAAQAFYNCMGLRYLIFRSNTPPTVANSNFLSGVPASCVLFVPDASLAAYQAATNLTVYANQMRPLSEFNINDFQ